MYQKSFFCYKLIVIMILGLMISLIILFIAVAATEGQEISRENILSKTSLATQWLAKQQRSDGSWPIVTQDKRSSVVATGLFGLGTFSQASLSAPNIDKALSFILAHQHNEGYWEASSSFSWNKVEATTAALYGLISAGYKGEALGKGMDWLIKNQKANGSWNDDCWDTCWALYLFLYSGWQMTKGMMVHGRLIFGI